MSSVCIFKTN